jgi:hypothetical protein
MKWFNDDIRKFTWVRMHNLEKYDVYKFEPGVASRIKSGYFIILWCSRLVS